MSKQTPPKICRWCDKEIVKDPIHRMYTALPLDKPRFYCTKDVDADRCQHIPK